MNLIKKTILCLSLFVLSSMSFAESDRCKRAGLVYGSEDIDIFGSVDFTADGPVASELTSLEQKQLITAAKRDALESQANPASIKTTEDAIKYFQDSSDNEFSLHSMGIREAEFDVVMHYPGDTALGYVFMTGSPKLIAIINDGVVNCLE